MPTTLKPFAAALLQFALLALGAFVLIPTTSYADPVTWLQFGVLVAGAIASVWVPLAPVAWRAVFKTGVVVLGGALSAAIPLIVDGVFPVSSVPLLALAVLQVLATETGVQIRTYQPKHAAVAATVTVYPAAGQDPAAIAAVTAEAVQSASTQAN